MAQTKDEIVVFFGEVQRVIRKYGIDHVMRKLREIREEETDEIQLAVFNYILLKTCNHYLLSKKEVLHSNKRGIVAEARRMCYALMKEHLRISDEQIGFYFGGKSRQSVNQEIKNLPLNQDKFATKDEAKFVDDFLVLTIEVLKYKNEYDYNKKFILIKK